MTLAQPKSPVTLYKYFPLQYAQMFIEEGVVQFSSLSWFLDFEDAERGDEFEGTRKYFPTGGLTINNQTQGQTFTDPTRSFQSAAKERDHIFIFSTSTVLDASLAKAFATSSDEIVCVELGDIRKFTLRLKTALKRDRRGISKTFMHGAVSYYAFDGPPMENWALPERIVMQKLLAFAHQREYRFAFSTKADAFAFQNVELFLVPENGARRPRPVLDESLHRLRPKLGSMSDCCRLIRF